MAKGWKKNDRKGQTLQERVESTWREREREREVLFFFFLKK
jgi:hypothetical protein